MPCFIAVLALFSPRLALIGMWIFNDLLTESFGNWILPFIGFFVLPWTTLAYALLWSLGTNEVEGIEWFFLAFFFFLDLASLGGGQRARSSRSSSGSASY